MAKKIKVAVIGAGNMGKNHVRNYKAIEGVELLAIADLNPATSELAAEYGIIHYTDYKKMLDELKPDAVTIAVPTPFHFEVGKEVMNRGIHCLIEKPIASTVEQADELIALAKKKDIVFTVGHIEHFNPVIRKLKELVDNDKLGQITSVVCKRVGGFPRLEPKTDVIIDLAVHDIDIISHLLGKQPKKIYAHGSRTHHSNKIDAAEILMDYGDASGFVQANWTTPVKVRTIAITGSKGYVEGNYITQQLTYYEHNMEKTIDNYANFVITMGDPREENISIDFQEPLIVELQAFIEAILTKKDHELVKPSDAREALRITLEAIAPYEV